MLERGSFAYNAVRPAGPSDAALAQRIGSNPARRPFSGNPRPAAVPLDRGSEVETALSAFGLRGAVFCIRFCFLI